jgi:Cdc6-like AAA superfamily ATPase
MALSTQEKEKLALMNIPSEAELRQMLDRFMSVSGLTADEVAIQIGYSRSAIAVLKSGSYNNPLKNRDESNSLKLRAAIKQLIDQHPLAEMDVRKGDLYNDATYKQIRRAFFGALDHGHAYCIDGAPGTRKTFILKTLNRELRELEAGKNGHSRRSIYVYCAQDITPCELLRRIAEAAQLPSKGSKAQLLKKLKFFLASHRCILMLDEVQHLSVACVEVARELFDEPPYFGIIFAGSHAVQDLFNNLHLEQARQRLSRTFVLHGLTRQDVEDVLQAEFGKCPPKSVVDDVVKNATAIDYRRSAEARRKDPGADDVTYISARLVWFAIAHMKEELANRKKGATA